MGSSRSGGGGSQGPDEERSGSLRLGLRKILARRFGRVPEPIARQIDAVSDPERLWHMIDRALRVESLGDGLSRGVTT